MSWVRIPLGAFDFFRHLFCLYIDRHIRVDLSDDEHNCNNSCVIKIIFSLFLFLFDFGFINNVFFLL